MSGHVAADPLPPGFIPDYAPQHVQDARPFGIGHAVEHVVARSVTRLDERAARKPVSALVSFAALLHIKPEDVLALILLGEESGEVGGEAFVEPDVRPVLAGQVVAEPLVRQLVRNQAVGVCLQRGDLVQ